MKSVALRLTILIFVISCLNSCKQTPKDVLDNSDTLPITSNTQMIDYNTKVKPILENRCVVCHGCYEAPCQIKLTSYSGLLRGAFDKPVYEHERLLATDTTRLDMDGQTIDDWRRLGFYPIVDDPKNQGEGLESSLLLQSILQKEQHPLPKEKKLSKAFTLGLNRENTCPTSDEYPEKIVKNNPLWGMPYALPNLSQKEISILTQWINSGAEGPKNRPLSKKTLQAINRWEAFFNEPSLKSQLMARYIFEHLFLANLHFDENTADGFFRLYRSKTPPGLPPQIINTRRPYDDPKTQRVYYRLLPYSETITLKNHMPYKLDSKRMKFWNTIFLEKPYTVEKLPKYKDAVASNPFESFQDIPEKSRYRFLLSEAQFTIMNFIKGPVCRGSVSLNVIRDQFWAVFIDPDSKFSEGISEALAQRTELLELASTSEDTINIPFEWLKYKKNEAKLLDIKDQLLIKHYSASNPLDVSMIWDGDKGTNKNAALTIFRNHDSASVEKGFIGKTPKTLWLIDYPLLERIHYLLAAGYDVYGNIGHHLLSRLHMDFLRMDGERNFLALLPQKDSRALRDFWYRDADQDTLDFLSYPQFESKVQSRLNTNEQSQKEVLVKSIQRHIGTALSNDRSLESTQNSQLRQALKPLEDFKGQHVQFLPDVTLIHVYGQKQNNKTSKPYESEQFTLLKNNALLNLDALFNEEERLVPDEFTVTLTKGVISAYPNTFIFLKPDQIKQYVESVMTMKSEKDYEKILDTYGVRRTDPLFWSKSDEFHRTKYTSSIGDYGLLDYGRLENR